MFPDRYDLETIVLIARNALERQYRTSFLGVGWMVAVPILQVTIFAIIMPVVRGRPHEAEYVLYLISTFPLWSFIIGALNTSTYALVAEAETIKRSMVSATVFPVAAVLQQFYTFLVSFTVMQVVWAVATGHWHATVLLVPLYLVPVLVAVAAMGVALAFLTPYVHDVPQCVHLVASVLFWLTPVVYPIENVPQAAQGWYEFNPVYLLMRPVMDLTAAGLWPSTGDTLASLAVMVLAVVCGVVVHTRCGRNFVYYL